jgi:hypothetical protein
MPEIQHDIQAIERVARDTVNGAGLSDFKITFGKEDRPHTLCCSADGSSVEITFRSEKLGKDLMKIESIEVVNGRDRPHVYVADNEVKEMHAQRIGVPIVTRFHTLSRTASSLGIDVIREAFNTETRLDLAKAHLTDIEITATKDGNRQVKGNLVLEDVILRPPNSIGINLTDPEVLDIDLSANNDPVAPTQKGEMLTLKFTLTEQELVQSGVCSLQRSVEALCSTQDLYGVQSRNSGAQILLAAIHAYPELAQVKAIPLNQLIERIREASTDTNSVAELRAMKNTLRNTMIFHLTDAAPVDRASLSEGDLILHAQPGIMPGISLQVYRVKTIEDVPQDYEADAKMKWRITSAEGEQRVSEVKLPQQEGFVRRIMETELPDGQGGLMNFHLNHDLVLSTPVIRRWKELDDITRDVGIKANAAPYDMKLNASVKDGVFSWAVILSKDPLYLAMFGNDLPMAIFPTDDRNISVVSGNREGSMERRILDIPNGTFEVPGYWKATSHIESLLVRYQKALSSCSDADVVALRLAGEI